MGETDSRSRSPNWTRWAGKWPRCQAATAWNVQVVSMGAAWTCQQMPRRQTQEVFARAMDIK